MLRKILGISYWRAKLYPNPDTIYPRSLFFGRLQALAESHFRVLDLGAGAGLLNSFTG